LSARENDRASVIKCRTTVSTPEAAPGRRSAELKFSGMLVTEGVREEQVAASTILSALLFGSVCA
jgi:hypothetical protein